MPVADSESGSVPDLESAAAVTRFNDKVSADRRTRRTQCQSVTTVTRTQDKARADISDSGPRQRPGRHLGPAGGAGLTRPGA